MRPIERIDNFLNKVVWSKLGIQWNIPNLAAFVITTYGYPKIVEYWKENPDQRIGQVLINMNILEGDLQIWCDEEEDILLAQGIAPEECLYWTSCYDKYMNDIPPISRLIKDLESEHINNIYIYLYNHNIRLSAKYKTAFKNVLVSRNEPTGTIDFIEYLWKKEII